MPVPKKKVVLITTSFPTTFDGREAAGTFVYDVAISMSRWVDLMVVAPGTEATSRVEARFPFEMITFKVKSLPLSQLHPGHPRDWVPIWDALRQGKKCMNELVRTKTFDHMLCLWALPSGFWGYQVFRRFGIPYSVWALGSDIWTGGSIPMVRGMLKRVLRASQVCLADGPSLVHAGERLSGRSFLFMPSARKLPASDATPLSEKPPYRLAFLGRWHGNKGADLLAGSLGLLTEEDWGRVERIRFAGGGPLEKEVREGLGRLQHAGYPLTIEGFKNREEAFELLQWSDYVLIPSRRDSIPVIFSDSMQCRSPVIATPVGDLPFIIQKYRVGVLSEGISSRAFAEAIQRALMIPPASYETRLAEAASFFDVDEIAKRVVGCISGSA